MSFACAFALSTALCCSSEPSDAGLTYRARFCTELAPTPVEMRFRVHVVNPKPRRGRIPRPRWGTWWLEGLAMPSHLSGPMLLAQMERFLYLAAPTGGARPEGATVQVGRRTLPLWSLRGGSTTELVELRKGLLALFRLQGDFPHQGLRNLDLRLEATDRPHRMAPPQRGEALLATLGEGLELRPLSSLGPETVK